MVKNSNEKVNVLKEIQHKKDLRKQDVFSDFKNNTSRAVAENEQYDPAEINRRIVRNSAKFYSEKVISKQNMKMISSLSS